MMHYCYHPEHAPQCVSTHEYEKLLGDGWYDSPTKFPAAGLAKITEEVKEKPAKEEKAVKVKKKAGGNPDSDMNKST